MPEFVLAMFNEKGQIDISSTNNVPPTPQEAARVREELLAKRGEGLIAILRLRE